MEQYGPTDYILIIGQQGNFQTRSMLVPAKEFMEARKDDYDLLKQFSIKDHIFVLDNIEHKIDNLLYINYIFKEHFGKIQKTEYTTICGVLTDYADGLDYDCYFKLEDKPWYDNTITNICKNFCHIKNYTECKKITNYKGKLINIIDSFLFLELRNDNLEMPSFETTDELDQFYHKKYAENS